MAGLHNLKVKEIRVKNYGPREAWGLTVMWSPCLMYLKSRFLPEATRLPVRVEISIS